MPQLTAQKSTEKVKRFTAFFSLRYFYKLYLHLWLLLSLRLFVRTFSFPANAKKNCQEGF